MIIKANKKYIDTSSIAHLLICGEKNVDIITFQVDKLRHGIDLSNCDFILRAVNENQNLIDQNLEKSIEGDYINLTWIINEYFTAVSGKLLLEIRAVEGDNLILKYVMSPIYVKTSATGEGLPDLNTVEKALDDMQNLLEQAQDIAVKTPYINADTLTWYVWNISINQFVDSGVSVKGDTGSNGISPTILVYENTDTSYKLQITDVNGTIETPNLKGADGSGTTITVDSELSNTSENPIQNKVINEQINSLWFNKLNYIYWSATGEMITKVGTEEEPINYGYFDNLYIDGTSIKISLDNINTRIDSINAFEYKGSHTQYYLSPQSAGTSTQNEMQVFVDGKVIPVNIVPYDLTSVQWRTYYIISWYYREDLNQTQIIFIASDPSAIVNVVCLPL